ncbi:MAG: hypothetical protein ABR521_01730 [Gaiellaceae bacterium]
MRRLLLGSCVIATALSAAALSGGGEAASGQPALRLAKRVPLTIAGVRFQAGERVTVAVTGTLEVRARRTASAEGSFTIRFANVAAGRCDALIVRATGSRGSRAVLRPMAPQCLPR